MGHVQALFIKTLMAIVVLLVVLTGLYGYPAAATIGLGLLIVVVSYIIGDLAILRLSNNWFATVADLVLTTAIIWIIGPFFQGARIPFTIALLTAVVISVGEWFFHKYIIRLRNKNEAEA